MGYYRDVHVVFSIILKVVKNSVKIRCLLLYYNGMMKYVIFTYEGLGLPVAHKLQQEGNDVIVGQVHKSQDVRLDTERAERETKNKKQKRLQLYEGIFPKWDAEELVKHLTTVADKENYFIFFDDNMLFNYAEQIQHLGFHGNFPTAEDRRLEQDRGLAKRFATEHYQQLHVGTTKDFIKAKEAIAFLKSTDNQWVLKGKDDHARTLVPESSDTALANKQLIEVLTKNPGEYEKGGFILELFIPAIIELTPEKIYYDGRPIATTVDIENKPLGSGNIGTQTGCTEDLVFSTELEDKINQIAFPAFVDTMAKQHKGLFIWDASILIDGRTGKMYFGEYCANRPGYNALFTEIALAGSASAFFEAIVKGKNPFKPGSVGVSLRMFNLATSDTGEYVSDKQVIIQDSANKDIWLWDVSRHEEHYENVGFDKNLAVITAVGNSVEEAVNRLYRNADAFAFEGAYYRPKFDYISKDYPTSILNRLNYGLQRNLYKVGFAL